MKLPNLKKKYVAGALAVGLIMGAGGIAAAYFSASGSATGHATVGHTTPFTITEGQVTGLLYPGTSEIVHFNVYNKGGGTQHWIVAAGTPSTRVLLYTDTGNIVTSTTSLKVTGCLTKWFSVTTTAQSGTIAPKTTQSTAFYATISMSNGTGQSGSTQNACENTHPKLSEYVGSPLESIAAFDGTYTTDSYLFTNLTGASRFAVSPSSLGNGGSATFSVTVTSTPNAAKWNGTTAELIIAGFEQPGALAQLRGEGSLIFAQDNSAGAGYCANDKFMSSTGQFVFGTGDSCYSHSGTAGSTETYSVTITGTNTFTDTVSSSTGTLNKTFTGTLSATANTIYTPAVHLLPGRMTTDLTATATFTVTNAAYTG